MLLFLAGVLAMVLPRNRAAVVVVVAGAFLIVDGVLGALASQNYGIEGELAVLAQRHPAASSPSSLGFLALMFSPLLVSVLTTTFLAVAIAIGAIAVGLTELFILMRYREQFPPIWSTVAGALIYIAIGAVLLAALHRRDPPHAGRRRAARPVRPRPDRARRMSSSTSLGARRTH